MCWIGWIRFVVIMLDAAACLDYVILGDNLVILVPAHVIPVLEKASECHQTVPSN